MVFHPHEAYPSSDGERRQIETTTGPNSSSPDILQCSIQGSMGSTAGGFSASLAPRQDYLDNIRQDDWVEIYLTDGTDDLGSSKPYMIASVDNIRRSRRTQANGATLEVISLQGRDYGKVLLDSQLVVDPALGSLIEQVQFEPEIVISKNSGNDIPFKRPDEVLISILERYHDKRAQALLPSSLSNGGLRTRFDQVRGIAVPNGNPNVTGNVWSTMEQYANLLLNELFVDTLKGVPTLTFREHPFGPEEFAALDSVSISETDVTDDNVGKSVSDIYNWFRVYPDAGFISNEALNNSRVGYVNKLAVQRSGIKRLEPTTNCFGQFDQSIIELMNDWSGILAMWNFRNHEFLSGSITTRFMPQVHKGMRLDYTSVRTGEAMSYFIESVSQNFAYPGASTTSISVVRGTPRKKGNSGAQFPRLKGFENLDEILLDHGDELQELQKATFTDSDDYSALSNKAVA